MVFNENLKAKKHKKVSLPKIDDTFFHSIAGRTRTFPLSD